MVVHVVGRGVHPNVAPKVGEYTRDLSYLVA